MKTDLQLLRDLETGGLITATSLELPNGMPYPKVEALFAYFGKVSHALRWYIGDLICWGEGAYGDKIYQAAEATGLAEGTLQNYASTCGRVPPRLRREHLSFAIHAEVAALNADQQERWLKLAEEKGWTVKQMRELLRDEGLIAAKPQPQWSGATSEETTARDATGGLAGPPAAQTAVQGGGGGLPEASPPPALPLAVVNGYHPHAVVLASRRDLLNDRVDRCEHPPHPEPIDKYERERDALNWALERLAPELA